MLSKLAACLVVIVALALGSGTLAADPTAELCGALGAQTAAMSPVESKRLTTDCFLAGLPTKLRTFEIGESIPMDVAKVELILDVEESDGGFGLHSLPGVGVHPVVRDLYCREFADAWPKLKIRCPLPPMFSVSDVDPIGFMVWGPQLLLTRGLPYDLVLRGGAYRLEHSGRDAMLHTRSLTFDGLTANYVALDHLVVRGDLTFKGSSIGFLSIEDIIVTGRIVFEDFASPRGFSFENTLVHGGIRVHGLAGADARQCDNSSELATTPISIDGPLFVPDCLTKARPGG